MLKKNGFSIVREYVGHGIGQDLHEDPQIPHYGPPNRGPRLKPGMVICVEPMVNQGRRYVKTLSDDWTVVTVDGKWCAHFEHTIALTEAVKSFHFIVAGSPGFQSSVKCY